MEQQYGRTSRELYYGTAGGDLLSFGGRNHAAASTTTHFAKRYHKKWGLDKRSSHGKMLVPPGGTNSSVGGTNSSTNGIKRKYPPY